MRILIKTSAFIILLLGAIHFGSQLDRGWLGVSILGLFYFLPSAIALARKHRSAWAICLVNVLSGWTVAGWFLTLVWALSDTGRISVSQHVNVIMSDRGTRRSRLNFR